MKLTALAVGAAMLFSPFAVAATTPPVTPVPVPVPLEDTVRVNGCTGWHISDGFVVTAAHCVTPLAQVNKVTVTTSDGNERAATLLVYAAMDDFAVLRVNPGKAVWDSMTIDCSGPPPIGTKVYMTGFPGVMTSKGPMTFGKMTHWGRIASEPKVHFAHWLEIMHTDLSAFGGFSGAAVRRESDGVVVAIMAGAYEPNKSMSVVVTTRKLCAALDLMVVA